MQGEPLPEKAVSDLVLAACALIGEACDLIAVQQALRVTAGALLDGRAAAELVGSGDEAGALAGSAASLLQLGAAPAQLRQLAFQGAAWETWAEVLLSGAEQSQLPPTHLAPAAHNPPLALWLTPPLCCRRIGFCSRRPKLGQQAPQRGGAGPGVPLVPRGPCPRRAARASHVSRGLPAAEGPPQRGGPALDCWALS